MREHERKTESERENKKVRLHYVAYERETMRDHGRKRAKGGTEMES